MVRAIWVPETGYQFVGGVLCLDFVNTVAWHTTPEPRELLPGYRAVLVWAHRAGLLTEYDVHSLQHRADTSAWGAREGWKRAVRFREALFRTLLHTRSGQPPRPRDLTVVNRVLRAAMTRAELRPHTSGWTYGWPDGADLPLEWPIWPVARSAADLLTSHGGADIGLCSADGCGWLFLDPAHRRRWCSMRDCGNRAKARRHYQRNKNRQP